MKATKTLLVFALLISLRSLEQDTLPRVYQTRTGTTVNILPDETLQILDEKGGSGMPILLSTNHQHKK